MSYLNKRVRLVGLTTEAHNNLQGVVSHLQESGRYTVLMDDGSSKSVQPKNLEVVGGTSPRTPRGINFPGLNSPQMQEALNRAMEFVQPVLQALPMLQGPVAIGLVVGLILLVWKIGLLRGLVVAGVVAGGLVNGMPHFQLAGGGVRGLWAAVLGLGTSLAEQASRAVSYRFNLSPPMGIVLFGVIVLILVQIVLSGGDSVSAPSGVDEAYAAGFKDASSGMEYGTTRPSQPALIPPSGSSGFGLSSLFSLGLLGKTAYDLGKSPRGWDAQLAFRNTKSLPPLQVVLLSFVIVRLLGLSPI